MRRSATGQLAARALAARPPGADWGGLLTGVRDRLVDRCSLEDHAPAAAQLAALAQQLAASYIEAYCKGCYASLGFGAAVSKADLPRDWLSQLLLQPLLRAACKGPARTLVANSCLLAHAVLRELGGGRWAKSAGVLHAAVDCLKHALKLTGSGALALCAGEALLPVQACISLLGPRLKLAALQGILQICTRAMQRSEWAVRKAAADTLALLAETLLSAGGSNAPIVAGQPQQGLVALEVLAPDMAAAVEAHLKYDRIPQCTHHIEHPQFSLRLRAAPPEAQLCLAAAASQQAAAAVHSVRFWAASGGADVGIEFGLAAEPGSTPTVHRYWLREGQLLQEHSAAAVTASPPRAAPAAAPFVQPAAVPAAATEAARTAAAKNEMPSPTDQHTPQPSVPPERQQQPNVQQPQQGLGRPADAPVAEKVPFESPLASLATAALPSFSPEKQPAPGRPGDRPTAADSPRVATTPTTAAAGWAQPGGSQCPIARPQSPAGQRSSSPDNQQRAPTVRWAASLRPPGEQRLAGLPDWDRSRPDSPVSGAGGITQGSEGGSWRGDRAVQGQEGRLQRLQEQLAANMEQIQRRLDEQQGHSSRSPHSPVNGTWPAGPGQDTCERGSSGESGMPAAWDEQDVLPAPGQRQYVQAAQAAQQEVSAPSSPASSCSGDAESVGGLQNAEEPSSGGSGVVLAVSNPLFGSSRPGTAEGLQSMQDALLPPKRSLRRQGSAQDESVSPRLDRQPRRQNLQASLGSLGSGFGVLHRESEAEVQQFLRGSLAVPRQEQQQQPRQPPAAGAAVAPVDAPAGSAGSNLSGRARGCGPASSSGSPTGQSVGLSHPLSGRSASHTPVVPGGPAALDARWVGSIDLGAILGDSRPASPGKSPLAQLAEQLAGCGSSSEGDSEQPWLTARSGGWHTARSGPAPDRWHPAHSGGSVGGSSGWQARAAAAWRSSSEEGSESGAGASQQQSEHQLAEQPAGAPQQAVAELQLLRISARSRSPSPSGRGPGGSSSQSMGGGGGSRGGSSHRTAGGSADLSDVIQQTYPPEAMQRLERLREQLQDEQLHAERLSPGRQQHAASPPPAARRSSAGGSRRSMSRDSSSRPAAQEAAAGFGAGSTGTGGGGSRGSSSRGSSLWSSPEQQLPRRCDSPELPGLHITLHQAKLLQSAVGRMPGNPGESADAAAIQEALMDVLSGWTLHVQKHYQRAAAEQLAAARRRHGGDAAAVQLEGRRLEAAREAAVRDELSLFVEQTLPRLAEVLSSRELLLRCFEAAAEQDEQEA
ncbi:hypothetical protein COHA_009122 [Chlorella ohadii]|uniref:Uncharacterized protein n=1 Tax=Chlorella ohadii TaxID=2649997 RepID=A0AAD5DK63_9CHLO|nr:hypothetical protein COHA_009122 [Chlorella ohadii]